MISDKSINYLLDTLKFYSKQYDKIADTCFNDVNMALNEIKNAYLPAETQILPYGSYRTKSNYQIVEPMEFYVVLHGDKDKILAREHEQMQENKNLLKRKKTRDSSIKSIYLNILSGS